MTGTLVSVDCKAGTLRLKAGGKELEMTAVTKTAKETLRKLKAGDRVRVSYTETEEEHLALPVEGAKVMPSTRRMAGDGRAAADKK
jgi:hypothetical protein